MRVRVSGSKSWIVWVGGVMVAALGAVSVAAAVGVDIQEALNITAQEPEQAPLFGVTDTTEPETAASDGSVPVTDTTLAPPAVAGSSTADSTPAPTVDTSPTTTRYPPTTLSFDPSAPPRVSAPTWDNRLPSTWHGLPDTECYTTFDITGGLPDPPHYLWLLDRYGNYARPQDKVIHLALKDPAYEPEPGTDLHDALATLGVSSAQDIRDMGEQAADVRWYAWYVTDEITDRGDPDHPSCASILQGADAVLTAPITPP